MVLYGSGLVKLKLSKEMVKGYIESTILSLLKMKIYIDMKFQNG